MAQLQMDDYAHEQETPQKGLGKQFRCKIQQLRVSWSMEDLVLLQSITSDDET